MRSPVAAFRRPRRRPREHCERASCSLLPSRRQHPLQMWLGLLVRLRRRRVRQQQRLLDQMLVEAARPKHRGFRRTTMVCEIAGGRENSIEHGWM